jgi:hypothetical protein
MADIIHCPSCRRKLQVPEALFGQDVQCPSCGATFQAKGNPAPPETAPQAIPREENPAAERHFLPRETDDDDNDDYDDRDIGVRGRRDVEPHRGTLILVLGILSLVLGGFGIIFGPIAWIMGSNDLAKIRSGQMDPDGESLTNAGRICGMIGTIVIGLGSVLCMFVFCLGALSRGGPHR